MEKINGIKYLCCFFIFSAGFLLMREINTGLGAAVSTKNRETWTETRDEPLRTSAWEKMGRRAEYFSKY